MIAGLCGECPLKRLPVWVKVASHAGVFRAARFSSLPTRESVFSPIGACITIWCTAGAVERQSQMFVYRLSPFPFPLLMIFSPFRQRESLFTGYVESWRKKKGYTRKSSSVGYVAVCQAGGRWFKSRPDQHSGPLNNWGESAAFVMTSANG